MILLNIIPLNFNGVFIVKHLQLFILIDNNFDLEVVPLYDSIIYTRHQSFNRCLSSSFNDLLFQEIKIVDLFISPLPVNQFIKSVGIDWNEWLAAM